MRRFRHRFLAAIALLSLTLPLLAGGAAAQGSPSQGADAPNRVAIILFDQMLSKYADQFDMPNFRRLRDDGANFKNAYLGYMASETVIAHNVIVSGQHPNHMGWVDEAYRDAGNLLGKGAGAIHITGDLSLADFGTIVNHEGYPKLADYLHAAYPGTKFITVGEKSYAVESATASSGDIAVRLSSRRTNVTSDYPTGCRNLSTDGAGMFPRWREPVGKNVPAYLRLPDAADPALCGRFFINSDSNNDYGTRAAFPSWIYPEDGNRFIPGTDASAQAGHLGGDTWVADAAIAMMEHENWSGIFLTLGAIDKTAHMWGADADTAPQNCSTGSGQTHVRCATENADVQLGKVLAQIAEVDADRGGETLVVLTADHGATYGQSFYGKVTAGASDSNWYYAPNGVWDGGAFDTALYNSPSPALAPLIATGNLQFSYQSTAIESWLVDRSPAKVQEAAAAMMTMPGVIASYWYDGDQFRLYGTNKMTKTEKEWWKDHGQEIVDTMAAPNGPDVVGLLHDRTSYGAYGDHGGAQESVQRVPMVFWSPSLAAGSFIGTLGGPFHTADVMPTILNAMDIPLTAPVDGEARVLR